MGQNNEKIQMVETSVSYAAEGDSFGEEGVSLYEALGGRDATARADCDTTLLCFDKSVLRAAQARENEKHCDVKVSTLRSVRGFAALPWAQLEKIAELFTLRRYDRGHVFYPERERVFYVLVSGEARVCSLRPNRASAAAALHYAKRPHDDEEEELKNKLVSELLRASEQMKKAQDRVDATRDEEEEEEEELAELMTALSPAAVAAADAVNVKKRVACRWRRAVALASAAASLSQPSPQDEVPRSLSTTTTTTTTTEGSTVGAAAARGGVPGGTGWGCPG